MTERGVPAAVRCDNRPELTSRHFLARCIERGIELVHIEPGHPVQNAHVESFHGKLRDECLNTSWFGNLWDAQRKIAAWKEEYNEERLDWVRVTNHLSSKGRKYGPGLKSINAGGAGAIPKGVRSKLKTGPIAAAALFRASD